MKKLVTASVVLAGMYSGAIVSLPAFAQATGGQAPAQPQGQGAPGASGLPASCSQITIKDPTEYNAYANAMSQSSPQAKAQAIQQFLQQYPNSVVKESMLEALMNADQSVSAEATLNAAKQVLQVNPNNLRALTVEVYLEKQGANGDQAKLDQAAADAQKGLNAPKDECMTQADYDKVKDAAAPIFYSAIEAFTNELKAYKDPSQTQSGQGLLDTYFLGNAYVSEDPKDLKNAVWFLTRAAQFAKPPYQQQIETAAEYWYKKYHCSQNDAACNSTPPQGFQQVQQLASQPANVFPPADYNPTQAPPPPSPADLAHQAISSTQGCANATPAPPPSAPNGGSTPAASGAAPAAGATGTAGATDATGATTPAAPAATPAAPATPSTPIPAACSDNLKQMALSDKEFILANGAQPDQAAIWSVMNGVTAQVPGTVVSAT